MLHQGCVLHQKTPTQLHLPSLHRMKAVVRGRLKPMHCVWTLSKRALKGCETLHCQLRTSHTGCTYFHMDTHNPAQPTRQYRRACMLLAGWPTAFKDHIGTLLALSCKGQLNNRGQVQFHFQENASHRKLRAECHRAALRAHQHLSPHTPHHQQARRSSMVGPWAK